MIFTPENIKLIESGAKTQTRRVTKNNEKCIRTGGDKIGMVTTASGRSKWVVGTIEAIQPGRGKKGVGFIRITGIRLERLDAISEADALAEGIIEGHHHYGDGISWTQTSYAYKTNDVCYGDYFTAVYAYRALWESINGANSWDENPMVWVIEFEYVGKEKK